MSGTATGGRGAGSRIAAVRDAVAAGLTEDEAAEGVRLDAYSTWGNYEQWFPLDVRGVHRWLASDAGR